MSDYTPSETFAFALRVRRRAAELSQRELARRVSENHGVHMHYVTVMRIELRQRRVVLDEAIALAEALNAPMESFVLPWDRRPVIDYSDIVENPGRPRSEHFELKDGAVESVEHAKLVCEVLDRLRQLERLGIFQLSREKVNEIRGAAASSPHQARGWLDYLDNVLWKTPRDHHKTDPGNSVDGIAIEFVAEKETP
jgi:transcriptional regulator with XRE-family HTH domain